MLRFWPAYSSKEKYLIGEILYPVKTIRKVIIKFIERGIEEKAIIVIRYNKKHTKKLGRGFNFFMVSMGFIEEACVDKPEYAQYVLNR